MKHTTVINSVLMQYIIDIHTAIFEIIIQWCHISVMASQITGNSIFSGWQQRKHQSPVLLTICGDHKSTSTTCHHDISVRCFERNQISYLNNLGVNKTFFFAKIPEKCCFNGVEKCVHLILISGVNQWPTPQIMFFSTYKGNTDNFALSKPSQETLPKEYFIVS